MGRSLEAITAELFARSGEADIDPTLDRIVALLDLMGDPQRSAPVIQITGTNGKSSTARMIEALLRSLGLRTGLFTSPHLQAVTERIAIDGEPIPAERFVELYEEARPLVDLVDDHSERGMSFFEVITALAFAAFADAPVDAMIIEVGLGGTWDSTSAVDAAVAVVTGVDIDHPEYLGTTIGDIAAEKAGIIKPGCVAVLGHQSAEAASVLLQRCAEVQVPVAREGPEFSVAARSLAVGGQLVSLQGLRGRYDDVFLPLFGAHQAHNAALALAAVEAMVGSQQLDDDVVRGAFGQVASPGRLEVLRSGPSVILDAAHNPAGARALAAALADSFAFGATVGVLAVLADKDAAGILEALEPALDSIICTTNLSPRAMPPRRLAQLAEEVFGGHRVAVVDDLVDALDAATAWADARTDAATVGIVVTGSVVTVGAARALLKGAP